ncbi:hypothetical protein CHINAEXTREME_17060 [Halobiforma lacisalsi AJ5]|uniref:Uncharacterized protein n=1 Tax=Natronobacterium lacisalsi AJ5 TaxID=358396 RepID=M0LSV1_NATLA|nr:hypothetical protein CHINAEXTREME_17060 [Halobiforma lacisalsi AJ5]EMA35190.1 hypothetical protein C445_05708 [Halobiforma lacisalsi AJ5]
MGTAPHARQEASPAKRSDARCACGAKPDGYDVRRNEPACRSCATVRADGGPNRGSPEARQADALEQIATELRYQNAVLTEVISTLDAIHGEGFRSPTAINTAIDDHAVTRDEQGVSR